MMACPRLERLIRARFSKADSEPCAPLRVEQQPEDLFGASWRGLVHHFIQPPKRQHAQSPR